MFKKFILEGAKATNANKKELWKYYVPFVPMPTEEVSVHRIEAVKQNLLHVMNKHIKHLDDDDKSTIAYNLTELDRFSKHNNPPLRINIDDDHYKKGVITKAAMFGLFNYLTPGVPVFTVIIPVAYIMAHFWISIESTDLHYDRFTRIENDIEYLSKNIEHKTMINSAIDKK